jgi:hypothetical protein
MYLVLDSDDDSDDEESRDARMRVFKRYDVAEVVDEDEIAAGLEEDAKLKMERDFIEWKKSYYRVCCLPTFFKIKLRILCYRRNWSLIGIIRMR